MRRDSRMRLALLCVCTVTPSACISRQPDDSNTTSVGDAEVRSDTFPGVLNILASPNCAGAKVGPRTILTAKHRVVGYAEGTQIALQVGTSKDPSQVLRTVVTKVTLYPAKAAPRVDVAVIEVSDDLGAIDTAPVASSAPLPESAITLVGYGCAVRPASFGKGGRAEATGPTPSVLRATSGSFRLVGPTGVQYRALATSTASATNPCAGEGGGLLYIRKGNTFEILAVNSRGDAGGVSHFIRVDAGAKAINAWVKSLSK